MKVELFSSTNSVLSYFAFISAMFFFFCLFFQQSNQRPTPLSAGMSMSPGQAVHLGAAAIGNILHSPSMDSILEQCEVWHTQTRWMPGLFDRGVGRCMASNLTVKGPSCARAAAMAQEHWRSRERKAVHFRSSQALPSMRCDFFLPFAQLLLFGNKQECQPVLHSPFIAHNAVPLSVTSAAGSSWRNGRNTTVWNRLGWFEEQQAKIIDEAGDFSNSLVWRFCYTQHVWILDFYVVGLFCGCTDGARYWQ